MTAPAIPNTLKRLAKRLFSDAAQQSVFVTSVIESDILPVALVWVKPRPSAEVFFTLDRPVWMPEFADVVSIEQRPGRHQLHDSGAFYCLDPSSLFMAAGLSLVSDASVVLDVCSSPGGKSVVAWKSLQPDQLWCNEVIGKRIPALISNLKRCGIAPASVINADTSKLAEMAEQSADVVLVDAPCSGQSLIARGKLSPGCFHPATINMNANRQRRILANAAYTVKPGGWLLYMTCTYSLKENERNVEWFVRKHSSFEAMPIDILAEYQSHLSAFPCYRLWPFQKEGAGGFTAAFRRTDEDTQNPSGGDLNHLKCCWKSESVC